MTFESGYDAIMYFGKNLYGDKFSLPEKRLSIYSQVYNDFMNPEGKGFLIVGSKGIGKSTLMRIMQKLFLNTPRGFVSIDPQRLKDMLESREYNAGDIKRLYGQSLKKDLYIDDIGIGQADMNLYGNITNIVAELLWERDKLWVEEKFRTHLSSNCPTSYKKKEDNDKLQTLEKIYGDRIVDRIKGMTNLIIWKGDSLRFEKHDNG